MSLKTDEQLALETSKNKEAFGELVERYSEKIHYYIARLIGSFQEAEDTTQDVFIKAYENIASFNSKLKFSSWLYRIAHNEAVNFIKKNYRYKKVEYNEDIENHQIESEDLILKIIKNENAKEVHNALLKLKTSEKEVLQLYYFEDKKYVEISDILQISINSVGPKIKRAKDKLKKIIENEQKT
jgi:RNA polymerase sigma-70 factor (ECF subfamily)